MSRRVLRLGARIALLVAAAVGIYLVVTFVQVWRATGSETDEQAQAIIVLGAAQYDGRPSPVLSARLDHALDLYRARIAPRIVVTGGKRDGDRFTEAAAGYRYLREAGVPENAILREEQGENTWEQLAAATRVLRDRGMRSAVLVSDDYHAYRLERIAGELGLRAQVSAVDPHLSFGGRVKAMVRETVAVGVGRVIGFRRLVNLDHRIADVRPGSGAG
jgi:uncharacterized SAM-binding protein YcdF (DUF218 family)